MKEPQNQPSPDALISGIHDSFRCFHYGLVSCVPVVGLYFSVLSSLRAQRARRTLKGFWNPARKYLLWGRLLSIISGFVWLSLIIIVICKLLMALNYL